MSFPEFAKRGGIWIALDPAQKDASERFSKCATDEDEVREQMEVNFYGPLRAVRACLPVMRSKGFGNLVLISSGAGFIARPARSSYSTSKFAIEAVYESLSHELKTFGVKVLIVEPGALRTPFASKIRTPAQYQMVNGTVNIMSIPDFVKGDPDKAGRAIANAVIGGHDYLRMLLGPDCVNALEDKIGHLQEDLDATRSIATGTNFG
ncbi:hypothetical protein EAF00_011067 [Botryotinia globosa]|nr:hypothetical protein EAF00_011067 [Botryotinia globosa]